MRVVRNWMGGPNTNTTTRSTPRIALNRVSTLARTMDQALRLDRPATTLTRPARRR
jgi:hypothetical protein